MFIVSLSNSEGGFAEGCNAAMRKGTFKITDISEYQKVKFGGRTSQNVSYILTTNES